MVEIDNKYFKFLWDKNLMKCVTEIPGIDERVGLMLKLKGFTKAAHIMSHYCKINRDYDVFIAWLQNSQATISQATDCYNAVKDWCTCHNL